MTRQQNLTRIAASGTAWLMGSSVTSMLLSLATQIALGWFLSKNDFGLYALAMAIATCLQVFRDGGVALWLARKEPAEFDRTANQSFWLCLLCSLTVAVLMCLVAPFASWVYGDSTVAVIILVLAASTPFEAYAVVAEARLQVGFQFRTLAFLRTIGPVVRYGLTVLLAVSGWGALSLALPLIPVALTRALVGYATTRLSPWKELPSRHRIYAIFQQSRWVLGGTFASALFRQIDYLVLGLVTSTTVTGIYFFAYQLSAQPVLMFSQSLRRVLVPTLVRVRDDRERQLRATLRAAAFIGIVAGSLFVYVALIADAIEYLLWRGRWQAAVGAIRLLAAVMPLHLFALFSRMVIQSHGKFRLWGIVVTARSIGLGVTVLIVARWSGGQDATSIAAGVALYLAVSSIVEARILLQRAAIPATPVLTMLLPPVLYCVTVAAVCHWSVSQFPQLDMLSSTVVVTVLYAFGILVGVARFFRRGAADIAQIGSSVYGRPARDGKNRASWSENSGSAEK